MSDVCRWLDVEVPLVLANGQPWQTHHARQLLTFHGVPESGYLELPLDIPIPDGPTLSLVATFVAREIRGREVLRRKWKPVVVEPAGITTTATAPTLIRLTRDLEGAITGASVVR